MPLPTPDPAHYPEQLAEKHLRLLAALAPYGVDDCRVFASPPTHYRMRAEFRLWHEGEHCFYAMFDPDNPRQPVRADNFPVACERINAVMPALLAGIHADPVLRQRLYQAEFLATTTGDCLASLVYHKRLDESWQMAATRLADALGLSVIGRSRGQKCVIGRDFVQETLTVNGRRWHWQQPEGAFTQPNAHTNTHMLAWACEQAAGMGKQGDLLELYCGIGNFTLPLSVCFQRVLATEVNKQACRSAQANLALNDTNNVALARLSSEEITQALQGVRPFRRLRDIPLADYDFQCLLVDPPRAGLDPATRALAARFPNILYISCNPDTLFRDVAELRTTHRIRDAALFDQFPYTHHMECGLWLEKHR